MSNLALANNNQIDVVDYEAKARQYLSLAGNNLPKKDVATFLELCRDLQLNPFKREIYCVAYGNSCNIITGYEVYLKRAERTGKLNGFETEFGMVGNDVTCTIIIYRKDWNHPFKHTVFMSEYNSGKSLWVSKPKTMLKKVAISQGFRMCFPDELGGMPYTKEEMSVETKVVNVGDEQVEVVADAEVKSQSDMLNDIKIEIMNVMRNKKLPDNVMQYTENAVNDISKPLDFYQKLLARLNNLEA